MFQFYSSQSSYAAPRRQQLYSTNNTANSYGNAANSYNDLPSQGSVPASTGQQDVSVQIVQYAYNRTEIEILLKRYHDLEQTSNALLDQAKRQNLCSVVFQILMISLGLATSYIAAISGVPEYARNITTASLGFLNAILSGIFAMMKFTSNATLLYNAQREVKECLPILECAILNRSSDRPYQELIMVLDRLKAKYEMFEKPLDPTDHDEGMHQRLLQASQSRYENDADRINEIYNFTSGQISDTNSRINSIYSRISAELQTAVKACVQDVMKELQQPQNDRRISIAASAPSSATASPVSLIEERRISIDPTNIIVDLATPSTIQLAQENQDESKESNESNESKEDKDLNASSH